MGATTMHELAHGLRDGKFKRVCVMVGAGISTAAGIPDFRSPRTGIYHNLKRLNLPYPEAVFDIEFFRENPTPFYELANELLPGKFAPTLTHRFIALLERKGVLLRCYTQNIDTLERRAGVPAHRIVEAHGSFADNHCIDCGAQANEEAVRQSILSHKIPYCEQCEGLVKPDIVFFGEGLPERFFEKYQTDLPECDLAIVMGTSLQVHPFASLPNMVSCPRVLVNLERVGSIGSRKDDCVLLKACDEGVMDLCHAAGWFHELNDLGEPHGQREAESLAHKLAEELYVTEMPILHRLGIPLAEK